MDKQRVCTQYRNLKLHCVRDLPHKSFHQLWALMLSKSPYNTLYGDVLNLVHILLVIPVSSAECERLISTMNRIKCVDRPSLSTCTCTFRYRQSGPLLSILNPVPRSIGGYPLEKCLGGAHTLNGLSPRRTS